MNTERCPNYESAHVFAKRRIISERQVRRLIAEGKVPGIQTAKGFKINVPLFLDQLNALSLDSVTGGAGL